MITQIPVIHSGGKSLTMERIEQAMERARELVNGIEVLGADAKNLDASLGHEQDADIFSAVDSAAEVVLHDSIDTHEQGSTTLRGFGAGIVDINPSGSLDIPADVPMEEEPKLSEETEEPKSSLTTELPADKIAEFISAKPNNFIRTAKKGLIRVAHALKFINQIKGDLPGKDDNKITSALKILGLVSTLLSKIPDKDEGAMKRLSKIFNLKETTNNALMDLFNDFGLLSNFKRIQMPKKDDDDKSFLDQWGKVNLYSHPNVGIIGLRDTYSEVSAYILHSEDFNINSVWDLVWEKVNGCVDVQAAPQNYKLFQFSKYIMFEGHQFGSAQSQIDSFIEKNRKFISLGFERSYLFLGPPGSGKTTMSQRFARAYSKKILQFSPDVIFQVSDTNIIRLIQESQAEVILIDEIDKLFQSLNAERTALVLSRVEKIRKCRPGLITIFTANSVKKFPDAMLRPGRIDDIIEFGYPEKDDRKEILRGYARVLGVNFCEDLVEKIAAVSSGLTGAWLKEVVLQAKVSDTESTFALIEKMLRYAKGISGNETEKCCE